jgi:catechol 2,3-dioxygenase-like lactoylglutathione lyase family enzyme
MEVGMDKRFVVVSIWAEDVPGLVHFYRDVLGLALKTHHGHQPHFDVAGVNMVVLQGKPVSAKDASPPRFPLFALQVDDLDREIENLTKHDIELPWDVEGGPGTRYVMFHDPAGNLIELVENLYK